LLNAKPFTLKSDKNDFVKIHNPAYGGYDDFGTKLEEVNEVEQ
jgi:hypothetical protein